MTEAEKELLLRFERAVEAPVDGGVTMLLTTDEARTIARVLREAAEGWNFDMDAAPKDGEDVLLNRGDMPPIVAGWYDNGEAAGWSSYDQPQVWIEGKPIAWIKLRPLPSPPSENAR